MSADSFCLEYWSLLEYQVIQPGVVRVKSSSSSFSLNTLLPMMLICRILAASPSITLKFTPTRLRSRGVTVVVICTP